MLDWLFVALIVVLLLTVATHVLNGGVVFVSPMPSVRQATKAHIAVLLAVLAVVKAADYWLDRYEMTNSQRGFVQGATYAVVKAQLPAMMLLMLIALLTAGLFLSVVKTGSLRLPLIASALWLVVPIVGGVIYPARRPVARRQPEPGVARAAVHRPQRRRHAPGDRAHRRRGRATSTFGTLTTADVESDLDPLQNVRLLNPTEMQTRFLVDRGEVAGLTIDDLDVDRYTLDDDDVAEEVLIAARELDLDGVPNQSWQGLPPHQHPRLRAGDGAGRPGAGERAPRLPHGRPRAARAVLQPDPVGLRHRQQRVDASASATSRTSTRARTASR